MLMHRHDRPSTHHAGPRLITRRRPPLGGGALQPLVLLALVLVTCCFFVTTCVFWTRTSPSHDQVEDTVGTLLHVVDAEQADASVVAAEPAGGLNGWGRKGRLLAAWRQRRRRARAAIGGIDVGDDEVSIERLSEHDVELVEKFADFLLEAEREEEQEERHRHGGLGEGEAGGEEEGEGLQLELKQPLEDQTPEQQPSPEQQERQHEPQPQQRFKEQEQQPEPQPAPEQQEKQPEKQPAPDQHQQPEQQPAPEQHPDEDEQQQLRRQQEVKDLWLGQPLEDRPPDQQQQQQTPPEPKQEGAPASSVAEDSSSSNTTTATTGAGSGTSGRGSSDLEVLATLLAQYRVDLLVHKQKRQALPSHEDDATALRAFERTLTAWQAKPDVVAYAKEMGERVQRALRERQTDCTRTLVCKLNKQCGFGCQMHHAVHCLNVAVATNRALVLRIHPWGYSEHYESFFRPPSACEAHPSEVQPKDDVIKGDRTPHVFLRVIDGRPTMWEPPLMPNDVHAEVSKFHARPELWWLGQLTSFLLDLVDEAGMVTYPPAPYSAVHVRRTDKVGTEADAHDISEYMKEVQHHHVYLATDEPAVVAAAQEKYAGNHTFHANIEGAEAAKTNTRYSDASLRGLIQDVFALARADFLISRLAYELAQTRHVDGTQAAASVDSDWYFGGWIPYVACLKEPYEGFPAGYAIHFNGEVIERIGHVKDPRSGRLFPLHLTENCSPSFPNLFDKAQPDITEELPPGIRTDEEEARRAPRVSLSKEEEEEGKELERLFEKGEDWDGEEDWEDWDGEEDWEDWDGEEDWEDWDSEEEDEADGSPEKQQDGNEKTEEEAEDGEEEEEEEEEEWEEHGGL